MNLEILLNPQVTSVQFDEFGDPIDPVAQRC